jgi:hypothetical protein
LRTSSFVWKFFRSSFIQLDIFANRNSRNITPVKNVHQFEPLLTYIHRSKKLNVNVSFTIEAKTVSLFFQRIQNLTSFITFPSIELPDTLHTVLLQQVECQEGCEPVRLLYTSRPAARCPCIQATNMRRVSCRLSRSARMADRRALHSLAFRRKSERSPSASIAA